MRRARSVLVGMIALCLGMGLAGCTGGGEGTHGGPSTHLTNAQIHQKMYLLRKNTIELMARGVNVVQYGPYGDHRLLVVLDEHTAVGSFAVVRRLLGSEGLVLEGHGQVSDPF